MLKDCMPDAYSGEESFIFFSYSHANESEIVSFVNNMSKVGCRIWYDRGIESGVEWDDYIAEKIDNCYLFVAFISSTYLNSDICKDELRFAEKKNKNIVLVFLDGARLSGGLEMRFDNYQSIFYLNYSSENAFLEELLRNRFVQSCKIAAAASESKSKLIQNTTFEIKVMDDINADNT